MAAALLVPSVVPPLDSHPAAEGLGVLLLLPAVERVALATHLGGTLTYWNRHPMKISFLMGPFLSGIPDGQTE